MATIAAQSADRHDVRIADMVVWRKSAVSKYMRVLREFRPRVVGFTAMTFQYQTAVEFAYLTKQFDPSIKTVIGGYHATLFAEAIGSGPDRRFWDFVVRGEGDFSFGEILDSVETGRGIEKVLGVSYKEEDGYKHNPERPLEDVTKIKIPARDKRLASGFHMYFRQADVIETSRGCTHLCNFCSITEMYGRSFRVYPIERVLADVEDCYRRGARHIFVTDDNITLDMDRFEAICEGVARMKFKNLRFTTQASPIGFANRPEIARKMREAGFVSIFLGIENASAKNLRAIKKPNTLASITNGVKALQKEDIIVIAGLINGLRDDDPASIRENYQFIKNLGVTSVMDQLLTPYPKTPLRDEMLADDRIKNMADFRWYDGYFGNARTEHLSSQELMWQRWKIRREVIGQWRATKGDWRFFKGYTYLWELGLRHVVWLNERVLERVLGQEGRYKLQMRYYMSLNDFGIKIPGRPAPNAYNPVFGTEEDPLLIKTLAFVRKKLVFPRVEALGPRVTAAMRAMKKEAKEQKDKLIQIGRPAQKAAQARAEATAHADVTRPVVA
jgi:radical SAM superfamily enzyme YgiQ (UPF0313 family)